MAKLTKFKAQKVEFPTHYRVEETNRGDTKIKNITPAYGNINEAGTPETEVIYDGMQLGNVHTLHAVKTTSLGIDYYSCDLDGLNEFGLKNDLKIRLTVDSDNKNINPKLRLNSVDYTILKEFNGTLLNLNAGDLKQNKTYEITYNGNQFVIINITEFGTESDTVLEGKRLAEIIGLEFGGNIQDAGAKVTGKFYYDKALKYYYECIANNSLTYNDGSKFRAISNKPILDKVENLYEIESQRIQVANGDVIFTKKGKIVTVMVRLQNDGNSITFHENQQLLEIPAKFRPSSQSYGFEAALASSSLTPGLNGATRMQINPTNITIWGAHLGRFNVLKGSATYFID